MKDLKIILKMFWAVICGLFTSDKESDFEAADLISDRFEISHKNKMYLKKYSGKKRYVKSPAISSNEYF